MKMKGFHYPQSFTLIIDLKFNFLCLEDDFRKRRRKTSSRRLHQDECLLGFNLIIRLKNVLKTSSWHLEDVLKTSWRHLSKTSWRHLEDVLKMSWKPLEDVLKTFLQDVLKTSWRRIAKTNIMVLTKSSSEDVSLRRTYSSWSRRIEDVFKTSSEDEDERRLQDVFIKTNICWD